MKNFLIYVSMLISVILLFLVVIIPKDTINKYKRKVDVEYSDNNYVVTIVNGTFQKSWRVKNGKITSVSDKGYYYFYTITGNYVQTPIELTIIETE